MKIHLIGAGGAGVSALGKLYLHEGHQVSGSDRESNQFLESLIASGLRSLSYDEVDNISSDLDLVVYTNAIIKNGVRQNELDRARELGIETLSYPEALGQITKKYTTVAVAGTHGKTTTTAMVLHILNSSDMSPTGIVGSLLTAGNSNYIPGDSNLLVIEADEYMRAFLNHSPSIIGVTNIDHDHHDIYPTIDDVKSTFREFADKLPPVGTLVCSALDQNSWDAFDDLDRNLIDYSAIDTSDLELLVPGEFNIQNAQLAIALCSILGVPEDDAKGSLKSFKGTWRRQELKGKTDKGQLVFDDYAHHPTEVAASINGFCDKFSDKNITVIFQPHLYSRTEKLWSEFIEMLSNVILHQLIILPIYAAREIDDYKVSSEKLVQEVTRLSPNAQVVYAANLEEAKEIVDDNSEVVITMGAGDVTKLSDQLIKK